MGLCSAHNLRAILPSPLSPNPIRPTVSPPSFVLPPPALALTLPPTPPRRTSALLASKAITKQTRSPSPVQTSTKRRRKLPPSDLAPVATSTSSVTTSSVSSQQPNASPVTRKRKDATKKKLARKTAHSLIERRRRGKMNEEFGKLRELVPGCKLGEREDGKPVIEMHKLEVLQRTVKFLDYLRGMAGKGIIEAWEREGIVIEEEDEDGEEDYVPEKERPRYVDASSSPTRPTKISPPPFTGLQTPQMEPENDPIYTYSYRSPSIQSTYSSTSKPSLPQLPPPLITPHGTPAEQEAMLLLSLTGTSSSGPVKERRKGWEGRRISVHDLLSS